MNEYPEAFGRRKLSYIRGLFQERLIVPDCVNQLQGGIVIDLPDNGCRDYLKSIVDLEKLPSDELLIENLENLIEEHKFQRRLKRLRERDHDDTQILDAQNLLELPVFTGLDSQSRELIKRKFQHILDRPSSISAVKGRHLDHLQYDTIKE